jgi:hypothetical protein
MPAKDIPISCDLFANGSVGAYHYHPIVPILQPAPGHLILRLLLWVDFLHEVSASQAVGLAPEARSLARQGWS